MKKTFFLKVFCCLLILCLFSGCKPQSPLLAHADDMDGLNQTQVMLVLGPYCSVENAEGKELRWFSPSGEFYQKSTSPWDRVFELDGDMEYTVISQKGAECEVSLYMPFSKAVTVRSLYDFFPEETSAASKLQIKEGGEKINAISRIIFYSDDHSVMLSAYGDWSRAVYHCNNVTELYGDLSEFGFRIVALNNFPEVEPIMKEDIYDLKGSGGDHVIIALIDGEILTEGMEGNYTVSHYHRVNNNITTTEMEYDENGNLLSTTEKE